MTFLEWLHMEYLEPEPSDNYYEKDMVAAWNQAVAQCRQEVRKLIMKHEEPGLTVLFHKLNEIYWRGEDDGH